MDLLPHDLIGLIFLYLPYPQILHSKPEIILDNNFWLFRAAWETGEDPKNPRFLRFYNVEFKENTYLRRYVRAISRPLNSRSLPVPGDLNAPGSIKFLHLPEIFRHSLQRDRYHLFNYALDYIDPKDNSTGEIILRYGTPEDLEIYLNYHKDYHPDPTALVLFRLLNPKVTGKVKQLTSRFGTDITEYQKAIEGELVSLDAMIVGRILNGTIMEANFSLNNISAIMVKIISMEDHIPLFLFILDKSLPQLRDNFIVDCLGESPSGSNLFSYIIENFIIAPSIKLLDKKINQDFRGLVQILRKLTPEGRKWSLEYLSLPWRNSKIVKDLEYYL